MNDPGSSWSLWLRQVSAILSLELFKHFVGWRALRIYILAAMPVLITLIWWLVPLDETGAALTAAGATFFAWIYRFFILRFVVVIGCAFIFIDLIRGEITDRSLHYYFMTPVRREVLAAGKYLSALVGTMVVLGCTTVLSYLLMLLKFGIDPTLSYLFEGPGAAHLASYTLATLLACMGYGSLFLLLGLLVKNPILPILALVLWELGYSFLPAFAKKISVVHYLQSLMPVPLDEGPFALLAEPTPAWISIPGLLVYTAVVLFLCFWRIRRMEIRYETD